MKHYLERIEYSLKINTVFVPITFLANAINFLVSQEFDEKSVHKEETSV